MVAAAAGDTGLRDFCPDRPGLNTPACTMDKGHADVEIGLVDWTLDRHSGERTDDYVLADTLVRYGLSDSAELQLEWEGLGFERSGSASDVRHGTGSGDLKVAVRKNLHNPDGSGFSIALMPFVTLPVGDKTFGRRGWTTGLVVPISYDLPHGFQLAFTGEADAAADEVGSGHHLVWNATAGLQIPFGEDVSGTLEFQQARDDDPGEASNMTLGAFSLAWQLVSSLQFDVGSVVGMSHEAPDVEFYAGIARRF
jgi:Putative MetA-pathway of phenol degradation